MSDNEEIPDICNKTKIPDNIRGHIYIATCITTNKSYVGKTKSLRWNHIKWRPHGYKKRWNDHLSEAIRNVKKCQCTYLNNAIRKYGRDDWTLELLVTCDLEELNAMEIKCVAEHNTLYPNGYNLTNGGDGGSNISDEQRRRISTTVTKIWEDDSMKKMYSSAQLPKNDLAKIEKVSKQIEKIHSCRMTLGLYKSKKDVTYDIIQIHFYDKHSKPVNVTPTSNKIQYGGAHFTIDDSLKRIQSFFIAIKKNIKINFINEILKTKYELLMQDTSIAGNSLEPSTTTLHNASYVNTQGNDQGHSKNVEGLDNPQPLTLLIEKLNKVSISNE